MWKDPAGLLRKMWSAQPWKQRTPNAPDCWQRKRDEPSRSQPASTYFRETFEGAHCQSNWFEGNKGSLGGETHTVQFTEAAPAVLGFDETIDQYCGAKAKSNGGKYKDAWPHARQCIEADVNILSLYGNRVPYNICRNLEWMVCAAKGSLPGQGGDTIVFSLAPSALDPSPTSNKPFGMCRGYTEADCKRGYATDSIYFLEVCIFDQVRAAMRPAPHPAAASITYFFQHNSAHAFRSPSCLHLT